MTREPPMPPAGWAVAAVAHRVGVSVSTLRSWEHRYGLRPQAHTSGGHRRYSAADVALLQRMRRLVAAGMTTGAAAAVVLGASPPPGRAAEPASGPPTAVTRLADAARRLDTSAASRLARAAISERGAAAAWSDVFVPVLQQLGRHWARTASGVECEHMLADVVQVELDRHRDRLVRSARPRTVLLSAVPGEGHTLPLHAVAAALAERGTATVLLGSLPVEALSDAVGQLSPTALLVWTRSRELAATSVLRTAVRSVPLVCAAGPGWPARQPGGAVVTRDLASTVDLLSAAQI